MNASPDLIRELASSRPTAPPALRVRIRELAAAQPAHTRRPWPGLPLRRVALVAVPAALALAVASAGVVGLSRSDGGATALETGRTESFSADQGSLVGPTTESVAPATAAGTDDRAQRVNATLTLEVSDSDGVARAAQDALDLTRTLRGHVVNSSVATGAHASATLTLRIPVQNVQRAIAQLSALGEIVSQQVQVEDLQATLDELRARRASLSAQIARITARLESQTLSAEARAALVARRRNLRADLHTVRGNLSTTSSEARAATMQVTIATPDVLGSATAPSRLDRTLDEALEILAWEGLVALAIAIVLAPLSLVALVALLARRVYRRHEDERLLAA